MRNAIIGLLTAGLLILMAGCADNDENRNPGPPAIEAQVTVSVNPDTIWFVYGETALAEIAVLVIDADGQPMAGSPVVVHVSDSNIGEVDFDFMGGDHSTAWDTTDSGGRAVIPYLAVLSGDNTVMAVAEGDTAYTTAFGRYPYNGSMLTVNLVMIPVTWDFAMMGDTAQIDVGGYVRDDDNLPVPGLYLHFTAQRGHPSADSALTDADGMAQIFLTGTADDFFIDDVMPEITVEVTAGISIFSDAGVLLFRRP